MDRPPRSPMAARSASAMSTWSAPPARHDPLPGHGPSLKRTSTSTNSTPLSSAPQTPVPPVNAPLTPNSSRRQSYGQNLRQSTSSPRLVKRSSRSSLSGISHQSPDDQEKRPTPKRSISNLISGLRESQATMASIPEPVVLTAPDIAKAHFARELEKMEENADAETLVLLHDACYGHRFSRPKISKSGLSMIVERPERLHAAVLGAAAAYVRLGEHFAGAKNAPHPERVEGGLVRSRLKVRRTRREMDVTSSCVTNVHGTEWMNELQGMCNAAGEKLVKGEKELGRTAGDGDGEKKELHQGDLYLSQGSLDAFQGALGGVADAVDAVFSLKVAAKRAFAAVRPPGHHCSADYPSGFCWLNNVHVGLEYAAQTHGLTHAAIIDFDLHHGDGSQAITWERNRKNNDKRMNAKPTTKLKLGPEIGYYSLHDINSFPCEMGDDEKVQAASLCVENAHSQSVWNVHLQPWRTEEEFWQLYESRYRILLDKARLFLRHHTARLRAEGKVKPKAAVFISAGFDASEWEGAGMQRHKVNVPTEFYARFTRDMVKLAQEDHTGCDGRVISVLEGGYSDRALCSGVLSHLAGLCTTAEETPASVPAMDGVSDPFTLAQTMDGLSLGENTTGTDYDSAWWSAENLTALEAKVNPPPPPPAGKKFRTGPQPTYATPTESFAYKVVDPNKFARSISGTMREATLPSGHSVQVLPPAPPVDWILATQVLSEMLVPQDRQTRSCTHEELAAPKVKAPVPSIAERDESEKPRQLRTRTRPAYSESPEQLRVPSRTDSRADRRRTIADLPLAVDPARRSSRRSSMASTLSSEHAMDIDTPPVPALPSMVNGAMKPPVVPDAGLQVKKARAPPKLKKATSFANSAPVSPADRSRGSTPAPPPAIPAAQNPTTGSGAMQNRQPVAPPRADGMDALTTGMKKVTLKAPTREEHDRKMKEKLDADRRARALKGAETRRVNAAAKKAKVVEEANAVAAAQSKPEASISATANFVESVEEPVMSVTEAGLEHAAPVPTSSTLNTEIANPPEQSEFKALLDDVASTSGIDELSESVPHETAAGTAALIPPEPIEVERLITSPTGEPAIEEARSGVIVPERLPAVETQTGSEKLPSDSLPEVSSQAATQAPAAAQSDPPNESTASMPSPPVSIEPALSQPSAKDTSLPSKATPLESTPPIAPAASPARPNLPPMYSYTYVDTRGDPSRISSPHSRSASGGGRPLPKFSATGVIPFARSGTPPKSVESGAAVKSSGQESGGREEKAQRVVDVWEVPETPAK